MENIKRPLHMIHNGGYFEPDVNTYCNLGDGFGKGFFHGTRDNSKVTCKNCLRELAKDSKKKSVLPISDVSGCASDFEKDLYKLVNNYCKQGLIKTDLVSKMEYVTKSCKIS